MRVLACACLLALALSASAGAARRPTPRERQAIVAAVRRARIDKPVLRVRVSTVARGWAYALLPGGRAAIVRRRSGRWRVTLVGGAGVGCHVPYAVRRDLHLIC